MSMIKGLPPPRKDNPDAALAMTAGEDGIRIQGVLYRTFEDWKKRKMGVMFGCKALRYKGMYLFSENQVMAKRKRKKDWSAVGYSTSSFYKGAEEDLGAMDFVEYDFF